MQSTITPRHYVKSHKGGEECYQGIFKRAGQGSQWYAHSAHCIVQTRTNLSM